jgi:membrane protein implicated in regulation of membrane protease activity
MVTWAIIIGVTVVIIDVFWPEYLFNWNTEVILIALVVVVLAYLKQLRDEKRSK